MVKGFLEVAVPTTPALESATKAAALTWRPQAQRGGRIPACAAPPRRHITCGSR